MQQKILKGHFNKLLYFSVFGSKEWLYNKIYRNSGTYQYSVQQYILVLSPYLDTRSYFDSCMNSLPVIQLRIHHQKALVKSHPTSKIVKIHLSGLAFCVFC